MILLLKNGQATMGSTFIHGMWRTTNLPKDLENRKIILRLRTPRLIKDAGLLGNLNKKLKNIFRNPIFVDCIGIDLNPMM